MGNNILDNKARELEKAARRCEHLAEIYNQVYESMQWHAMDYHSADENHKEGWYTEPEVGEWNREKYETYLEVLKAIEKLAK